MYEFTYWSKLKAYIWWWGFYLDSKSTNFRRNKKISWALFANIGTSSYLCNVKMDIWAIQVSFLRGQAVYVTTRF